MKAMKDNNQLGKFQVTGIPTAPFGFAQTEVTFNTDANSISNVFAVDKKSRKEKIKRLMSWCLSMENIEYTVQET